MKRNRYKKTGIALVLVVCFMVNLLANTATASAAVKSYITNKNFAGTYYMKGGFKKANEKHGAYNVVIGKISKSGKLKMQVGYAGRNYSPLYDSNEITAQIKGNKATFQWEDSWENKGTGTIVFVKKHKFYLTMKETVTSPANRATLATEKKMFLYYSKDCAINPW